jgi:NADH-quinone oxidoreductase subunit N
MNPIFLEAILVCVGFFLLLAEAFLPKVRKEVIAYAAMVGAFGVFLLCFAADPAAMNPDAGYANYYLADDVAIFFKKFLLLATIFVLVLAVEFAPVLKRFIPSEKEGGGTGEIYCLMLFACAGMMWMVSATNFMMIFISLELVTISFYIMVAYMRRNRSSLEAGIKFLILGAVSTAMSVYGIAWIFGTLGTTHLVTIRTLLPTLPPESYTALLFGVGLVLVSISFKVAAFPFQFWVPDVYQGAPTPITAFLATASKAAAFIVLMRILEPFLAIPALADRLIPAIAVLAALTMIMGNLAAIPQTNFKRLLAYSSIAHAGYLLMGVASVDSGTSGTAISYYLVAYMLMTIAAFAVTIVVINAVGGDNISDFNGLAQRSPLLATALTIAVLSMAGLPFTAGFFGKFFIFEAAVAAGQFWLVGIGLGAVGCGFYFYLKVVRAMYWMPAPEQPAEGPVVFKISPTLRALLFVLIALLLIFGVYPAPVFSLLP